MSVALILVAAGRGERAGGAVPKQLVDLGGETMLRRSVVACDAHPAVDELVVVLPAEWVADGPSLVGSTRAACRVVAGGARRQDSVRAGLSAVSGGAHVVLIHDAARPFVSRDVIDRVIAAAQESGAAIPAVPVSDTVKRVAADDTSRGVRSIVRTELRSELWLAQTPQGFRRDVIQAAIDQGAGRADATDDAQLVEWSGRPVQIVEGDVRNLKITTARDLEQAQSNWVTEARVGTGYDLHQLVAGRALVLAGVVVPFERGPLGHSDGDVVCHALTDAILGAAGAGDIGQMFPNTDPRWKDAAGLDLLSRAVTAARERGWTVVNADVTVILERPKVSPQVDAIRANLAAALGVAGDAVSVKGKTNEGVDAVGRGEAIAAHAVALLKGGKS